MIADAFNNISDAAASLVSILGFKLSCKKPDIEHPFGHGRLEYISGLIISFLILFMGLELLKSSFEGLFNPSPVNFSLFSIIILIFSILIKFYMYFYNSRIAKKIDSVSMKATAQDSFADMISTFVVIVSIVCSKFTTFPTDALAGIFVALFILYTGIESAKETIKPLLGTPPSKEFVNQIEEEVCKFPHVVGIHDLIVHNYGPGRIFASVHIEVPVDIDIVRCPEQVDLCEKVVGEKLGVELVVHMDPIVTNDETVNKTKEQLRAVLGEIDRSLSFHDFRMTPKGENRTNLIFDVVLPVNSTISEEEISEKITTEMRKLDPTFFFVITFDKDYTGTH
jgi:cation diffusion facilitator family transporter